MNDLPITSPISNADERNLLESFPIINKKIIFAILAHKDEAILASQLKNIKYYNPNSHIVLYNGGTDVNFGKKLNVSVCPYSHKLNWGYLPHFLWDIMRWLTEIDAKYDYLVNLDHDMLFIKRGYVKFLDKAMNGYDYMGWDMKWSFERYPKKGDGAVAIEAMQKQWLHWKSVFGTDHFIWSFNPGQVFRKDIVTRIVSNTEKDMIDRMMEQIPVRALEEMLFSTLVVTNGGKVRGYPKGKDSRTVVRWGRSIKLSEVKKGRRRQYYYWIHPVKGQKLLRICRWLLGRRRISTSNRPSMKKRVISRNLKKRRKNH